MYRSYVQILKTNRTFQRQFLYGYIKITEANGLHFPQRDIIKYVWTKTENYFNFNI